MVTQNDDDQPVDLVLSLTKRTEAKLHQLAGNDCLHSDRTPTGLALDWLLRWDRLPVKALNDPDRFGPGTEQMTVTVDRPLWQALRVYGLRHKWGPEEVASAVINDWGGFLSRNETPVTE